MLYYADAVFSKAKLNALNIFLQKRTHGRISIIQKKLRNLNTVTNILFGSQAVILLLRQADGFNFQKSNCQFLVLVLILIIASNYKKCKRRLIYSRTKVRILIQFCYLFWSIISIFLDLNKSNFNFNFLLLVTINMLLVRF